MPAVYLELGVLLMLLAAYEVYTGPRDFFRLWFHFTFLAILSSLTDRA